MKKSERQDVKISIKLSKSVVSRLDELSTDSGFTRSALIKRGIALLFKHEPTLSALDGSSRIKK